MEELKTRIIERIIVWVNGIVAETFDNLEDGKIALGEIFGYTDDLFQVVGLVRDAKEVPAELEVLKDPALAAAYMVDITKAVEKRLSKIKALEMADKKDVILSIVKSSVNALVFNAGYVKNIVSLVQQLKH